MMYNFNLSKFRSSRCLSTVFIFSLGLNLSGCGDTQESHNPGSTALTSLPSSASTAQSEVPRLDQVQTPTLVRCDFAHGCAAVGAVPSGSPSLNPNDSLSTTRSSEQNEQNIRGESSATSTAIVLYNEDNLAIVPYRILLPDAEREPAYQTFVSNCKRGTNNCLSKARRNFNRSVRTVKASNRLTKLGTGIAFLSSLYWASNNSGIQTPALRRQTISRDQDTLPEFGDLATAEFKFKSTPTSEFSEILEINEEFQDSITTSVLSHYSFDLVASQKTAEHHSNRTFEVCDLSRPEPQQCKWDGGAAADSEQRNTQIDSCVRELESSLGLGAIVTLEGAAFAFLPNLHQNALGDDPSQAFQLMSQQRLGIVSLVGLLSGFTQNIGSTVVRIIPTQSVCSWWYGQSR